ncbi:putative fcf1 [Lyophyllum shimeji]|uniref:U three protein 23 n=1 Tax=Lyophyllum shimeji TaxID=47721 RepID=A0A9P3UM40_LYOSH|nr:putative fcf1 [Lyophyllum shimeji]
MRQKRAKAYKKLMSLYSMTFGFRQPYQVLVDSEMCKAAIDHKIELVKQLGTVLLGEVKPMITQCCIHELYLQGKSQQPAVDLAKTFERRKCNHREAIPGDDCLVSVVGDTNKHRYVIATQSQPLRSKLRTVPAVPIVHVNRTVMVLEPPSDLTIETKQAMEEKAMQPKAADLTLVGPSTAAEPPRKKKGPKGPNPLSVKKKKKPIEVSTPKAKVKGKLAGQKSDAERMPAKAGEKRKRDDDDVHDAKPTDVLGEAVSRPTKKRRRRKPVEVPTDTNS